MRRLSISEPPTSHKSDTASPPQVAAVEIKVLLGSTNPIRTGSSCLCWWGGKTSWQNAFQLGTAFLLGSEACALFWWFCRSKGGCQLPHKTILLPQSWQREKWGGERERNGVELWGTGRKGPRLQSHVGFFPKYQSLKKIHFPPFTLPLAPHLPKPTQFTRQGFFRGVFAFLDPPGSLMKSRDPFQEWHMGDCREH